jgi:hypothetical protein
MAIQTPGKPGRKVVENGDAMALRQKLAYQMVSDEPGPAGNENLHWASPADSK